MLALDDRTVLSECAALNFEINSPRLPDAALVVDVTHGADRLVADAYDLYADRGAALAFTDAQYILEEYDKTPPERQRALMIATDVNRATEEFGYESRQVKMARELYAVEAFDAASHGIQVPYLEPTIGVASGDGSGSQRCWLRKS